MRAEVRESYHTAALWCREKAWGLVRSQRPAFCLGSALHSWWDSEQFPPSLSLRVLKSINWGKRRRCGQEVCELGSAALDWKDLGDSLNFQVLFQSEKLYDYLRFQTRNSGNTICKQWLIMRIEYHFSFFLLIKRRGLMLPRQAWNPWPQAIHLPQAPK